MITLEEQIRRYAVDVAGPAVAERPTDLDVVGSPRHRGRWMLVGALALFVAGLAWMATRPSELGDRPSVDTVPSLVPTSWPGEVGPCTATESGVQLHGPDGEGLCVGVGATDPPAPVVRFSGGWDDNIALGLGECSVVPEVDGLLIMTTDIAERDRSPVFMAVSPSTRFLTMELRSGRTIVAETTTLPGLDGVSFAGFWTSLDDPPADVAWTGSLERYSASAELLPPVSPGTLCTPTTRPGD